jgi:hypothetical protein
MKSQQYRAHNIVANARISLTFSHVYHHNHTNHSADKWNEVSSVHAFIRSPVHPNHSLAGGIREQTKKEESFATPFFPKH